MTKTPKILLFCLFVLVWSCDSKRVFEDDQNLGNKAWHMDYMPEFTFEIEDTNPKDVFFKMRNDLDYPYQNIYLTYYLLNEQGEEIETKLINIPLFNEVTGKPYGKGNSIYQSSVLVLDNYSFPSSGEYTFKMGQYMRTESLVGVHSVGVRVEEAN